MEKISLIIIILSILMLIYSYLVTIKNNNYPKKVKTTKKNAILIPARDESKVIESLLISIENQTQKINPEDIYVIVESSKDRTVKIVKKHKMNIIYRKDLTKQRKGYALDDVIKEIIINKSFSVIFFKIIPISSGPFIS